jgi:predicted transcriptional regulator
MAISENGGKVALLAIDPQYAELIVQGIKKVEFRKRGFRASLTHVVLYSSSPVKRIVGYFAVNNIRRLSVDELWDKYCMVGGISKDQFLAYYSKSHEGIAIEIGVVNILKRPVLLSKLGESIAVPQSFCYLSKDQFKLLIQRQTSQLVS